MLYSAEFRRLAGVTQVAPAGEGPSFHNRLTHSIKVAQVGSRLAEYLVGRDQAHLNQVGGLDPEVVGAACLAHDIGHPPFGHAAEHALQERFKKLDLLDSFEGNAQSFRIVTFLSAHKGIGRGLDLTRATMNALIKYPCLRTDPAQKKWGAYKEDEEAFRFARELCPDGDSRKSAEAEVMEWADDVSYATHDLEDFYRVGLAPLDQLLTGVALEEFTTLVKAKWAGGSDADKKEWAEDGNFSGRVEEMFVRLRELVPPLVRPYSGRRDQLEALHKLTSKCLDRFLNMFDGQRSIRLNQGFDPGDPESRRVIRNPLAVFEVELLKDVTALYVFQNPTLVAQQSGQTLVVAELFDAFFEAFDKKKRNALIPHSYTHLLSWCAEDPSKARSARAAADVIASLTEDQAHRLYLRLKGVDSGTLHDPIVK